MGTTPVRTLFVSLFSEVLFKIKYMNECEGKRKRGGPPLKKFIVGWNVFVGVPSLRNRIASKGLDARNLPSKDQGMDIRCEGKHEEGHSRNEKKKNRMIGSYHEEEKFSDAAHV